MADYSRLHQKIGRNEKCWCGSGRKFKHCHIERQSAKPMTISDVIRQKERYFGKKLCLCPTEWKEDCDGAIVKAHTVSRKSLAKFAKKGHVYGLVKNFGALVRNDGKLVFEKMGIRKASVFTGFCQKHDTCIFEPIENKPFKLCEEHAFLLAYRSFCYEMFTKKAAFESMTTLRQGDAGRSLREQMILQRFVNIYKKGLETSIRDQKIIKNSYDKILISKDYRNIKFYAFRLSHLPDVMCSACVYPTFDFHGNRLQKLANLDLICESISISVLADDANKGLVVFTWIGEEGGACDRFIQSLNHLSDYQKAQSVIRFVFEFIENKYLKMEWWDDLDDRVKTALDARQETATNPMSERKSNCLIDDGLHYVDWEIEDCETNIELKP